MKAVARHTPPANDTYGWMLYWRAEMLAAIHRCVDGTSANANLDLQHAVRSARSMHAHAEKLLRRKR